MADVNVPDSSIPSGVWAAVREAVRASPDAETQIAAAEAAVRRLGDFTRFRDKLSSFAVRALVYHMRHRHTVATKNANGDYLKDGERGVRADESESVRSAYKSLYENYYIGGTALGHLRGDQLDGVASSERARADGHLVNAELVEWLKSRGVSGERQVKDVVPERLARQALKRIRDKYAR